MTRRWGIALSGMMTASLLAGMVGAQVASNRLTGSAAPVRVVRQAPATTAPVQPAQPAAANHVERE